MEPEFHVFLSYNSQDRPAVVELAKALILRRIRPWLDIWNVPPGRPWQDELEKVIQTIPAAAALVGAGGQGPWQRQEVGAVLHHFLKREVAGPVIPVLLPGASTQPELPLFLHNYRWVDLRDGQKTGLDLLVWGITGDKPAASKPQVLHLPGGIDTLAISRQDKRYRGEPLCITLQNADLIETLRSFAEISGLNFVIHRGVSGNVTVDLRFVPWDQALDLILTSNNLQMIVDGNVAHIKPLKPGKREDT